MTGEWNSKDFPSKWQKLAHISMEKLNWKVIVADKLLSTILKAARAKKRSYVKKKIWGKVTSEILLEDLFLPRTLFEVASF